MRGYAKVASVGLLMVGVLAMPNLSLARDGDGKHHLLNADLRAKVERLRDKIEEHRGDQHHNNQGGIPGSLQALQTEVATLRADLAAAKLQLSTLSTLDARLKALETTPASTPSSSPALAELAKYISVDLNIRNGVKGPHVIFHHANVHVESGSGTTFEAGGLTGLGNLIVGYNEGNVSRVGSHNLVVGPSHAFTSTGGVVFGENNSISAKSAAVLGGLQNHNEGERSSILGAVGQTISPLYPEYTIP